MIKPELLEDVQEVAALYGFDWRDLAALVDVESSGGRNNTPRLEAGIKDLSFGVCQVLTATAVWIYERGYMRDPKAAVRFKAALDAVPHQGIRSLWRVMEEGRVGLVLGAGYLHYQKERYGSLRDAVAAYNAGSVRLSGNGYSNQAYVDKWAKARQEYDQAGSGGSGVGRVPSVPSAW